MRSLLGHFHITVACSFRVEGALRTRVVPFRSMASISAAEPEARSGRAASVSTPRRPTPAQDEEQHPVGGSVTCGSALLFAQEASAGDPPLLLYKSGRAAQLFSGA